MGNNIIEESVRSNRRRLKECQIVHGPIPPNSFDDYTPPQIAITSEPTTPERGENTANNNKDSKKKSSWLSWFGF